MNSLEFSGHPWPVPMGKIKQLLSSFLKPDVPLKLGVLSSVHRFAPSDVGVIGNLNTCK